MGGFIGCSSLDWTLFGLDLIAQIYYVYVDFVSWCIGASRPTWARKARPEHLCSEILERRKICTAGTNSEAETACEWLAAWHIAVINACWRRCPQDNWSILVGFCFDTYSGRSIGLRFQSVSYRKNSCSRCIGCARVVFFFFAPNNKFIGSYLIAFAIFFLISSITSQPCMFRQRLSIFSLLAVFKILDRMHSRPLKKGNRCDAMQGLQTCVDVLVIRA